MNSRVIYMQARTHTRLKENREKQQYIVRSFQKKPAGRCIGKHTMPPPQSLCNSRD